MVVRNVSNTFISLYHHHNIQLLKTVNHTDRVFPNPQNLTQIITSFTKMAARSALLAVAALAARAHAQSSGASDIYSVNQCPPDSNNLEAYNLQLDWSTSSDGKGSEFSGCYSTSIDLPDWPTTDNGKYEVWVDTSSFGEGCSMLFYNLLDSNEESNNWPCRSLYRQVQKSGTPCGDLDLTKEFGFA